MSKFIDLDHRKHFSDPDELEKVRRYQTITCYYLNGWLRSGMRVLDVGASEGYMRGVLNIHKDDYLGIDISPIGDFVQPKTIFDLKNFSFDLIIYCHVLEHIKNPFKELTKASLLLSPGGYLFVAVPHAAYSWAWEYKDHIALFNLNILTKLLNSVGLGVLESFEITFRSNCTELWVMSCNQ